MPSQHKHPPISFRPPEDIRARLLWHAKATGTPAGRLITQLLKPCRADRCMLLEHGTEILHEDELSRWAGPIPIRRCTASIEEPGLFYYDCELAAGHEGPHVVHWDQDVPEPKPAIVASPSSGYTAMLTSIFGGQGLSGLLGRI